MSLLRIKLKMLTCLLAVLTSCKRLMLHGIYLHPILSSCCKPTLVEEAQHYIITLPLNEWGEPTASYRWTGWAWEITGWSSRLQENYLSFKEESMRYTLHQLRKAERSQRVTGWTWNSLTMLKTLPGPCFTSNTPLLHFHQCPKTKNLI